MDKKRKYEFHPMSLDELKKNAGVLGDEVLDYLSEKHKGEPYSPTVEAHTFIGLADMMLRDVILSGTKGDMLLFHNLLDNFYTHLEKYLAERAVIDMIEKVTGDHIIPHPEKDFDFEPDVSVRENVTFTNLGEPKPKKNKGAGIG